MSLFRKGLLVSGGQLISIVMTALSGILFARVLGPDGIGRYALFMTTAQVAGALLAFGIGPSNVYFLNNRRIGIEAISSMALKVSALLGVLLATGLVGMLVTLPSYFGSVSVLLALTIALGACSQLSTDLLYPVLVAQLDAKRMVSVVLGRSGALLTGGGLLAITGLLTTDAAVTVFSMSSVVGLCITLWHLRRHLNLRSSMHWPLFREVVAYGIRLSASGFMYLCALNVAVFLLRHLERTDFAALGLYTRASSVCSLIVLFPHAIGPLLYSKWSTSSSASRVAQVELAARFNTSFGIVATGGVIVLAKPLLWLLYGARFIDAAGALRTLAPAVLCLTLLNVFVQLLASDGKAAITAWLLAGAVAITSAVTVVAVPLLGIKGAALGTLSGNAFAAAVAAIVCARMYGVRPLHCLLLRRDDLVYGVRSLRARHT